MYQNQCNVLLIYFTFPCNNANLSYTYNAGQDLRLYTFQNNKAHHFDARWIARILRRTGPCLKTWPWFPILIWAFRFVWKFGFKPIYRIWSIHYAVCVLCMHFLCVSTFNAATQINITMHQGGSGWLAFGDQRLRNFCHPAMHVETLGKKCFFLCNNPHQYCNACRIAHISLCRTEPCVEVLAMNFWQLLLSRIGWFKPMPHTACCSKQNTKHKVQNTKYTLQNAKQYGKCDSHYSHTSRQSQGR